MIFQEPMTSLNPVFRVGDQVAEAVRQHLDVSKDGGGRPRGRGVSSRRASPTPSAASRQYPHELSGGMRQRVMIAMAPLLPAEAAHRRRADDRARRDDPGADPRAHPRAPGADRRRAHAHHARPRRGRRDGRRGHGHVRGPGRRARHGRRGAPRPEASLHRGPARVDPEPRACAGSGSTSSTARSRTRSTCRPAATSRRAAPTASSPARVHDPRLGDAGDRSVACWRWLEPPPVPGGVPPRPIDAGAMRRRPRCGRTCSPPGTPPPPETARIGG